MVGSRLLPVDPGAGPPMPPPLGHPSPGCTPTPPPPLNCPKSLTSVRRWRKAAGTASSFLHDQLQILSLFFPPEAWPPLHVAKHRLPASPTGFSLLFSPPSRSHHCPSPWTDRKGAGVGGNPCTQVGFCLSCFVLHLW